ncbi:MAG: glutamine amidotransferase [Methylophilaceae bacterium]|jgi:glutamine amidotransferase|tara:strand:+ start:35865 stop:36512 length:648 start_codon:yes stop_codon:yes gene_type:complete
MKKIDIAVVDYGMGNLRSVSKAIEHVASDKTVLITSNPEEIHAAERVVFPGQGAMPECMQELDGRGLHKAVVSAAKTKPFLGICIGLQMLFDHSEEGDTKGLGLLEGNVKKFALENVTDAAGEKLKVPHMGWNQVYQYDKPHPMWQGIASGERFYFVHSYYVSLEDEASAMGYGEYPNKFTCAVAQDNIFAVQFHPEKSAQAGLQLLRNFVNWKP